MKSITLPELQKLLKIAAADSKRNACMILLAFRHGMRCSEICNLKLSDVDLKNQQITIRRLKNSLLTIQPLVDEKGNPLMSELRMLRAWLAERRDASEYVFTSQKGGRLDRSAFFRMFQDVAERAGLPESKRHPHCLKHGLAVTLVDANVNLASIRVALGHRSIASTAVYAMPSDESTGKLVTQAIATLL
jgi:site-specific recombinase XerD